MTGKSISFYILGAFITGTILLIYIQFNSSKNIDTLIDGNEKLISEFKVNTELNELEKNLVTVESKVRSTVNTKDSFYIEGLEMNIKAIEFNLDQLQKVTDDDSSVVYIDYLDKLVHEKLLFNKDILDTFHITGKGAAQNLITTKYGKTLTDSIITIANKIDSTRKWHLADATVLLDKSGKKAQQFSTVLIIFVLISAAGLFWYIINIIHKQESLIQQLNVSEKKVKESVQLKENFMANMSHEIRTPMNAILGFTHLLQQKQLDEESKEYVQTIHKSGENLLSIINDILDLSKIEAGMIRIETIPFNIRELLHSIEVMFKPKAIEKKLTFSVVIDQTIPDILEGDSTRLTQILVNLVGNALKFTDKGVVSIKIINHGVSENIIYTEIIVTDTGIGIDQEKLQQIFERFHQAEDSVTRKYGGTGLGLSIVRDLVLLQRGTINVESEPGNGTTFKLNIPYKISADKFAKTIPAEEIFTPFYSINSTILVVEDNEINQSLIKHLFKSWGLNYDLAKNGKEAIDKLILNKYELILMDIQMPEMDGYTATQEIRQKLKLTTPIIAMTAHAFAGERDKCLYLGMNEYISKPIQEEQLYQLIGKYSSLNAISEKQKSKDFTIENGKYKYIDLQYMKEISNGNIEYEKTVTEQFIETIPPDLQMIEKAWQSKEIDGLKQLAHNMKTSVSVMGLTNILQPFLDVIEHEKLNEESFTDTFSSLKQICEASVTEAKQFYSTLLS
jgi:signal transduction histidine kinase/CheY-like chemotaxis protein/HPt (histidine-containing phosphotransfer) domain-containing protein